MKKIWGSLGRTMTEGAKLQQKDVNQVERIQHAKVTQAAPRHPTEKKHIEDAQKNQTIKQDLETKDETLVENMNKFTIESTNPVERWTSSKQLPTRETEWLHRHDPVWEYGFYEPPEEKIPKNKLMFREALEVMRARLEVTNSEQFNRPQQPEAEKILKEHSAVNRVDAEKMDRMWNYFRPFERRDEQKVVSIADLAALQEAMHGYSDEAMLTDGFRKNFRKMLDQNSTAKESFERLDEKDQQLFIEAVKEHRESEHNRLAKRLSEIHTLESEKAESEASESKEKQKKAYEDSPAR